jgi:crossover junction endodeoxyribonuclease RuvC
MRILGIDPGLATLGFGMIDYVEGEAKDIHFGHISTPPTQAMAARLQCLYREVKQIVERFAPDAVVVEDLFFSKNRKTAIQVAQARGVIILATAERGVVVFEYTPMQIKQAVVGYGNATKRQVQQMVKALLKLDRVPSPNHAADALAAAICHAHSLKRTPPKNALSAEPLSRTRSEQSEPQLPPEHNKAEPPPQSRLRARKAGERHR